jgi:hypothetical protein
MPRREDHKVHKDMWWYWIKKEKNYGGVSLERGKKWFEPVLNIYTHTPFPHSHSNFFICPFKLSKKLLLNIKIWERHLPPLASSNYAYVYYIGQCWALFVQF